MRTATILMLILCGVAAADEPEMAGTPVSQPLQPVTLPDVPPPPPPVTPAKPEAPDVKEVQEPHRAVLPRSWSSYDLLLWWSKSAPIPNLVTASPVALAPVLGGRDTSLLVGGEPLGKNMQVGFRFNMGWALCGDANAGIEFGGLFLGTKVRTAGYTDSPNFAALGRPYIDATTGQESSLLVAGGNTGSGVVQVATTTRVTGWEVNYLRNLVDAGEVTVSAIAGYRYFSDNESLQVQQQSLRFTPGGPPSVLWGLYDQFDARNNYHGGQVGLKIDGSHGRWLFAFAGKVAFGTNFETVYVTGNSSATTAALPQNAVQPFNAGFLAVSSNSGRNMQAHFAVLPEAKLNIGYRLGDTCHLFAGYDFIYLSDAVRPGDQVDLTIDPSRSPVLSTGAALGPPRPRQPFVRSEFWVQGLVLGFDCRY